MKQKKGLLKLEDRTVGFIQSEEQKKKKECNREVKLRNLGDTSRPIYTL